MANNIGTLVISPIRPQSDADMFPSAFSNELLGGWHQVSTIGDRNAIPADRKANGMSCYVTDMSSAYIWNGTGWGNLAAAAAASTDLSSYTLLTTTASISGSVQTQINTKQNHITLVAGSNVSIVESPTDTWTITAGSISGGGGSGTTTLIDITGSAFSPDGTYDVYNYYLTGPATIAAPGSIVNGEAILFKLQQPSGGAASLILSDAGGFTWKKPNNSITLSTDTGYAEDILTVLRIGSQLYVSIVKNF